MQSNELMLLFEFVFVTIVCFVLSRFTTCIYIKCDNRLCIMVDDFTYLST